MYRLKEDHMEEIEIKKSRFLCYLHPCTSEEDAKTFINEIKKLHPNASHHCYAFILGERNEIQRSNGDKEPSGTAGSPMLKVLTKQHMQDSVAVSVRYFGGIKLGATGLIRAYTKSVTNALASASFTKRKKLLQYELYFSYELINRMDFYMRQHEIEVLVKDYEEQVRYEFLCENPLDDEIAEITNGVYLPHFLKSTQRDQECNHP